MRGRLPCVQSNSRPSRHRGRGRQHIERFKDKLSRSGAFLRSPARPRSRSSSSQPRPRPRCGKSVIRFCPITKVSFTSAVSRNDYATLKV